MKITGTLLTIILVATSTGCGKTETYEDCVLANLKGDSTPAAGGMIKAACREKFPLIDTSVDLSPDGLGRLTGTASALRVSGEPNLAISLYNGNSDLVLKQLSVAITTKEVGKPVTRIYSESADLGPLKSGNLYVAFLPGSPVNDFNWSIQGAKGIPAGSSK